MPNKLFNDTHKKDTMKEAEGQKKTGKEKTTSNVYGRNPKFATGMESNGDKIKGKLGK